MSDLIDRQAAIDAVRSYMADNDIEDSDWHADGIVYEINRLPTAEPHNFDEWCDDCKEYDHENHCCPRFNRVIRTAMEEAKPKTGRWIRDECGELYCSECGRYTEDRHDMTIEFEGMKGIALVPPNYCGYCGAKMKEVSDG